jgi:hypothetical protein
MSKVRQATFQTSRLIDQGLGPLVTCTVVAVRDGGSNQDFDAWYRIEWPRLVALALARCGPGSSDMYRVGSCRRRTDEGAPLGGELLVGARIRFIAGQRRQVLAWRCRRTPEERLAVGVVTERMSQH